MLEVFSEVPVAMRELPQDHEKTVAAVWTEQLSGGMHMFENWKRNPKFSLELFTDRPAKVDITISRPLDRWESYGFQHKSYNKQYILVKVIYIYTALKKRTNFVAMFQQQLFFCNFFVSFFCFINRYFRSTQHLLK